MSEFNREVDKAMAQRQRQEAKDRKRVANGPSSKEYDERRDARTERLIRDSLQTWTERLDASIGTLGVERQKKYMEDEQVEATFECDGVWFRTTAATETQLASGHVPDVYMGQSSSRISTLQDVGEALRLGKDRYRYTGNNVER